MVQKTLHAGISARRNGRGVVLRARVAATQLIRRKLMTLKVIPVQVLRGLMKRVGEDGRMVQFAEVKWNELLPEGGDLIPYLLEKDVPVYFRVDPVYGLVYRCHQYTLPSLDGAEKRQAENSVCANGDEGPNVPDVAQLQVEGFLDCDLAFLRLDRNSLEQIHISMSCPAPRFTRGGLVATPACRVIGNDSRGRPIKVVEEPKGVRELVGVEFDEAVVVGKDAWNQASRSGERLARTDPLDYVLQGEVKRKELFLDAVDIARLKQEAKIRDVFVPYPFEHQVRMPALFLMFQAAKIFNVNAKSKEGDDELGAWLDARWPDGYPKRAVRTAKKFVWLKLNRRQGGKSRGKTDLGAVDKFLGVGSETKYRFDFVSKYFSMILAIADYWDGQKTNNRNTQRARLASMLIANGFGGAEVGDLVHLIDGDPISDADERSLKKLVGESNWREVRDKEERDGEGRSKVQRGSRAVRQKRVAS